MASKIGALASRVAFVAGVSWCLKELDVHMTYEEIRDAAAQAYPVPMVTRQRVIRDPVDDIMVYRFNEGNIERSFRVGGGYGAWKTCDLHGPAPILATAARVKIWADLVANPLETVEVEE